MTDDNYQSIYLSPQDIKDREITKHELGYHGLSRPLTEAEFEKLNTRLLLKKLERNLISTMDKDLYYRNRPFFRNDQERIEFLRISDFSDRIRWLKNRNFDARISSYSEDVQSAIEQNDILLHMSMNAVRESWGEPDRREVSGSHFHGNEKWTYHTYQSTPEGYRKQDRTLYFENGRVIAWETE